MSNQLLLNMPAIHLIFGVTQLVVYLGQVMALEPGDVTATGTPAGVVSACKPPRFLWPGGVVEVETEGVGKLTNRVMVEA